VNPPLVEKVEKYLRTLGSRPDRIVVAVSGGPDSVALLRVLVSLRHASGSLTIAHLNHQLRGNESDADEAFVRQLHEVLESHDVTGLQLRTEQLDVSAQAQAERKNVESVARRVRYEWLARVARDVGAGFVATGHTADDQAETVLHRLLRGTGLKGLAGIGARRPLAPGIEVIRPLLRVSRAEVQAYLTDLGQAYRQDSSNLNLDYMRNRIRHELLPHLAQRYNPALVSVLCRLAEQARDAYVDQESLAKEWLADAERPRAGALLIFDQTRLAALPRHFIREVFRLVWLREGWPQGGMGFREWDRLAALVLDGDAAADLPGGIRARRRERVVQIGPASYDAD
jgi:tRNA(Ile)-lysidine synthase